ncbi:hypothetical protein C5C99_06100 [Rathayibacter sp. AY1C4]|nr:hypothetical protein C5C99_06100 [Rathayibacter sp. AY1C4]
MTRSASLGRVLRARNVAIHSRRTFSAALHALLLAMSTLRSADFSARSSSASSSDCGCSGAP